VSLSPTHVWILCMHLNHVVHLTYSCTKMWYSLKQRATAIHAQLSMLEDSAVIGFFSNVGMSPTLSVQQKCVHALCSPDICQNSRSCYPRAYPHMRARYSRLSHYRVCATFLHMVHNHDRKPDRQQRKFRSDHALVTELGTMAWAYTRSSHHPPCSLELKHITGTTSSD
jgi:hypothetical protein